MCARAGAVVKAGGRGMKLRDWVFTTLDSTSSQRSLPHSFCPCDSEERECGNDESACRSDERECPTDERECRTDILAERARKDGAAATKVSVATTFFPGEGTRHRAARR